MTPPVFSVVIPVFNKWELTAACLRSLREHTPEYGYEVIVVDNASGDATAAELPELGKSLFGARFTGIRFEQNRSFGPACNAGAAAASARLLFFLNNDTLLTPGWAPPLVNALAEDRKLAGVGPLLLYADDTVQHLGVSFDMGNVEHLYRGFPSEHPFVARRRYFQVITGAALLMPAAVFHKYAGFYEEYRNGFEDVDLCLRVHATGKKFSCVPGSRVYHLESQSAGRMDGEDRNATLLTERCRRLYRPDRHLFALEDGCEPFIDDTFGVSCILNEEHSGVLFREAEGRSLDCRVRLLKRHPLWLEGRMAVAAELERRGRCREALSLHLEIAFLHMSAPAFDRVGRRAAGIGDEEIKARIEDMRRNLWKQRGDRKWAMKRLQFVREKRDSLLEGMLEKAIRERFS